MAFPVKTGWDPGTFKTTIIDHYWGNGLQGKIDLSVKEHPKLLKDEAGVPGSLVSDYAKIGAFMTDMNAVLTALKPLEVKLREAASVEIKAAIDGHKPKSSPDMKSQKLLSRTLGLHEISQGFNNPDVFYADSKSTLHTEAYAATRKDGAVEIDSRSPKFAKVDKDTPVTLPKGVPTALGNVSGRDFNRILLRHGYQFKDVGAGIEHGEYTHRLHWFAIANGGLGLSNTCSYIYRSLGALWAAGRENTNGGTVYLWEALLDCFPTSKVAESQKSLAWCEAGACNCPDYLNLELIRADKLTAYSDDVANLWYLRVLMDARARKRKTQDQDPFGKMQDKIAPIGVPKKQVTEAFVSPPKPGERAGLGGYLIWYLNA